MNPLTGHQRETVARILASPFSMATVLYSICIRHFGEQVHDWEPETVWMELRDEFGVEIPPINHDRLMALLTAISTNQFYQNWAGFSLISHAITGDENPMDDSDPLLPAQMAWAVTEVKLNDEARHEFSHDVSAAVGQLLWDDGFVHPPHALKFARMPSVYQGSDSPADLGKQQTLSTEHAKVVDEYMTEQAATLLRQISALPWHDQNSLAQIVRELHGNR